MGFQVGHLTDQGRVRELNEDSYLVLTQPNLPSNVALLLAVADGMGGHQAGDVASSRVIATLDQMFATGSFQHLVDYNPERPDYYAAVLKDVIESINEQLLNLAARPGLEGMGTTATVALLSGNQLFVGHVGDSRAYLLRGGMLQQITRDHSWVADQVANGALTASEAYHHPKKNLLVRSLGNSVALRVDRLIQDVYAGDTIVLCSDGLANKVSDLEIAQVMASQAEPQLACRQLVHLANQRGGEDNITVIAVRLDETAEETRLSGGRAFGPTRRNQAAQHSNFKTDKIVRSPAGPAKAPEGSQHNARLHPAGKGSIAARKLVRAGAIRAILAVLVFMLLLTGISTAIVYLLSPVFDPELSGDPAELAAWTVGIGLAVDFGFLAGLSFGYWLFFFYKDSNFVKGRE